MQRLDRFLSEAGVASRRELRAIIRAGRVRVNDVPASAPEQKIDETSDRVTLDGEAIPFQARYYAIGEATPGAANADATFKVQYQ